jgi:predicted O-methyltransferase YrrM
MSVINRDLFFQIFGNGDFTTPCDGQYANQYDLVNDNRLHIILRPCDEVLPMADLIFIDAGHEYECVKKDTEEAMAHIKPGGVVIWHDYSLGTPGVIRCVDEINKDDRICNVEDTSICFKIW